MKKIKLLALTAATLSLFAACGGEGGDPNAETEARNAEAIRTLNKAFASGDPSAVDSLIADNFVNHTPDPSMGPKPEGMSDKDHMKMMIEMIHGSSSDMTVTEKMIVAQDNKVAAFTTVKGTNDGPMGPMPPSNLPYETNGCDFFEFNEDGQVTGWWGVFDNLSMMMQLSPEFAAGMEAMMTGTMPADSAQANAEMEATQ
jgi:hypothetical protein